MVFCSCSHTSVSLCGTNKATVFVLKTVAFLTSLVNPLGGLGQFKSFQKRKHMLRKMAAGVYLFCEDLYGGAGS